MFDALLDALESELRATLNTTIMGFVATARTRLEAAVTEIGKERAEGLSEVAEERAKSLVEVDARRIELLEEIAAMQTHQAKQEGRVELNIGGYRFQTSVQTLRRVPHTFFDAYFSGRYAQDVCNDGSIFVDRDGEHFGHVLQYMRDGVVSVADPGAHPTVSLLRALKREFGFYCIELCAEGPVVPNQPSELVFVIGGDAGDGEVLSSLERYDPSSGEWDAMAALSTARHSFGACVIAGELYAIGGISDDDTFLTSVEKYSPASDTWSAVAPLPAGRCDHATAVVGSAMYVLGGLTYDGMTASVLKFDSAQGIWSDVAPMPASLGAFASCTYMSDIYVFGGYRVRSLVGAPAHEQWEQPCAFVFKFDTEANEWSRHARMPFTCKDHHASILHGQVYFVGAGVGGCEVLRFDFATSAWRTLARTNFRRDCGVSFVLDECLYAAGGGIAGTSVERYDVTTKTWATVSDMLEGRSLFRAVCIEAEGPSGDQDLFDSLIAKALKQRT